MGKLFVGYRAWRAQGYLLDKMDLRKLVRAYVTYPAIQAYMALAILSAVVCLSYLESIWPVLAAIFATVLIYPLVWYLLHRFVLHGQWLYRSPRTAAVWKRVHFDHHQHPNDLSVLFGALYTTLPTIFIVTTSLGWLIGGPVGAAAALATGLLVTCFYEFCHCIQHLAYTPKFAFLMRMKKLHLAHHYHNEQGNFGITNFLWDRLFATFYAKPKSVPRSATVRNLGYTDEEAERYPWVAEITRARNEPILARENDGLI